MNAKPRVSLWTERVRHNMRYVYNVYVWVISVSVFHEYLCVCHLSHNLTGSEYLWCYRRELTLLSSTSSVRPHEKTRPYIWLMIIFHIQRTKRLIQAHISNSAAFPATDDNRNRITNMHVIVEWNYSAVRAKRLLFWFIILMFFLPT